MSAPDVTVIHADHMLDVKTATTLNDVSVVIAGGKILRVGTSAEASGHNIERLLVLPLPSAHGRREARLLAKIRLDGFHLFVSEPKILHVPE